MNTVRKIRKITVIGLLFITVAAGMGRYATVATASADATTTADTNTNAFSGAMGISGDWSGDQSAKLTVVVNMVNAGGGTESAPDFSVSVTGSNPSPSSFPGSSSGTLVKLGTGSYKVTEVSSTNYSVSYSSDCSGRYI